MRYLKRMFDHCQGRITPTIQLSEQGFHETVTVPELQLTALVLSLWILAAEIEKLRQQGAVEYLDYMRIENGQVITDPEFEQAIIARMTTWATASQERYYELVTKILSDLQQVDQEFEVPGLSLSSVGSDYTFPLHALKRIGADVAPDRNGMADQSGDIGGLDSRGLPKRPNRAFTFD